jgi:hypothetical protein
MKSNSGSDMSFAAFAAARSRALAGIRAKAERARNARGIAAADLDARGEGAPTVADASVSTARPGLSERGTALRAWCWDRFRATRGRCASRPARLSGRSP